MFDKCVKCDSFSSRFSLKLTFHTFGYDEKWYHIPEIAELLPWDNVEVCEKCWRKLNKKDSHAAQIYMIAKGTADAIEAKKQSEELEKLESDINTAFIEIYDGMINTLEHLDSQLQFEYPVRKEGRDYIQKIKTERDKLTQVETKKRTK